MSKSIVVVGAGHAAAEFITLIKRQGWLGQITLVGDEPSLPYQRPPLSKAYLLGKIAQERLLIRPKSAYEKVGIKLKLGSSVQHIDRNNKHVILVQGEQIQYDKLILAMGTRSKKLPIPGANLPQVHTLRTKKDADKIKQSLKPQSRILVVGGGYIGLEVAAALRQLGVQVKLLEAQETLLNRVTCPLVADFYLEQHSQRGVEIACGLQLEKLEQRGGLIRAFFNNGEQDNFDSVVVGVGVKPNVELAQQAGLHCENGVWVNQYCQTQDPDIYAIGDCSLAPSELYQRHVRIESIPNAMEHAKVAASHIADGLLSPQQVPWFWSDQYDIKLQTVGLLHGYDKIILRGKPQTKKFTVFYLKKGRLIAADIINNPADFMAAKKIVARSLQEPAYQPDYDKLTSLDLPLKSLI